MRTFEPFYINEYIIAIIGIIICVLIYMCTIQGCSKIQRLYIGILFYGIITTTTGVILWIGSIVQEEFIVPDLLDLIVHSIFLVIYIITIKRGIIVRIIRNITQLRMPVKVLLVTSVLISFLLTYLLLYYFFHTYLYFPEFFVIGTVVFILIILLGFLFPLLIISDMSGLYYKNLSAMLEKQMTTQVEHYEATSKINKNIKRFRHDYKNLMVGLIEALKHNNITAALEMLNAEEMMITEPTGIFETGSIVLDALLQEKQYSASKTNTSLTFEGVIAENILNPVDICIIFGNALDNAIEACANCGDDEKTISIRSSLINGFQFINVENPVATNVKIIDNNIVTTKDNKSMHGIGLRSIRTVVEKYNGEMTLSQSNGIFSHEINLDFNMPTSV